MAEANLIGARESMKTRTLIIERTEKKVLNDCLGCDLNKRFIKSSEWEERANEIN